MTHSGRHPWDANDPYPEETAMPVEKKSVDPKVYELAKAFLEDAKEKLSGPAEIQELAEDIQQTIEDFIGDLEDAE
jgi:hypothetical protein